MYIYLYVYLAFFQVDLWKPDSVTLLKAKTQVDFRVEADKSAEVEDLLKESGMEYR